MASLPSAPECVSIGHPTPALNRLLASAPGTQAHSSLTMLHHQMFIRMFYLNYQVFYLNVDYDFPQILTTFHVLQFYLYLQINFNEHIKI